MWLHVGLSLKEAAYATLPDFAFIGESTVWGHEQTANRLSNGESASSGVPDVEAESLRMLHFYGSIPDAKCRATVQLLLIQVIS